MYETLAYDRMLWASFFARGCPKTINHKIFFLPKSNLNFCTHTLYTNMMQNYSSPHMLLFATLVFGVLLFGSFFKSVSATPSGEGLVGYWPFDENTGTAAADLSPTGASGVLTNGPLWTEGKFSSGISFDGLNDFVRVSHRSPLNPGTSLWTVSAWVKTDANVGTIVQKGSSTADEYEFGISDGRAYFTLNAGGADLLATAAGTSSINDGAWHHVVGVRSEERTALLYVDGIQEGSSSFSGSDTSIYANNALIIGAHGNEAANPLAGTIDEVRVYNRALSSTEVQDMYTNAQDPPPTPTSTPSPTPTVTPTPTPTPIVTPTPTPSPPAGECTYPAQLIDLTNWKVTLPFGSSGSPTEVRQPALSTFSIDPFFMVNAACDGVQFRAPVNGVTTGGSNYPRSELREMKNNGGSNASWSTTSGIHTMIFEQAITAVPLIKKDVVTAQIHDSSHDIIAIRLRYPKLYITVGDSTGPTLDANYILGKRFTVKLEAGGGKIKIYYNGSSTPAYTLSKKKSGLYFKAGAYTHSNCSIEASCSDDNYGEVQIYNLVVMHQ